MRKHHTSSVTLETLMTPAPVTIAPGATLRDAVDLLSTLGVSGLPVTENEHVVGLLSSQSIIAFEAGTPGVPTARDPSESWDSPNDEPDEDSSVEFFTALWDDSGPDAVARFQTSETAEWDMLSAHTVDEAMTRNPPELPPTASVRAAATLMRSTGSHGVLVVDRGRLCGIVTTMDIARLVSGGPDRPAPTPVS